MLTDHEYLVTEVDKFFLLVSQSKPELVLTRNDSERWITAHGSAEAAFPAFLASLEWRKKYNVDEILKGPKSAKLEKQIKSEKAVILPEHVRDDNDRPIIVCYPTRHDKKTKLKYTIEHMVYYLEEICSLADRNNVKDMCVILNLENFGVTDMDYSIAKSGLKILVNYYPERLGVLYIINTPTFFHACYKIIQNWIYQRTRDKIRFIEGQFDIENFVNKNGVLPPELFANNNKLEKQQISN